MELNKIKENLKEAANAAAGLVFPENIYCVCCGDAMENSRVHGICDACASKIDWDIGNPFRHRMDEFSFSDVFPCCRYGFYVRRVMNRLKLFGDGYVARGLGALLAERLLMEEDFTFDFLTPVPMYKKKMAMRGYNQAELLARYAAAKLGRPLETGVLVRTLKSDSMRYSGAEKRRLIASRGFEAPEKERHRVEGKTIVLVDDVVTTGSTADASARALLSLGAAKVAVLSFAAGGSGKAEISS